VLCRRYSSVLVGSGISDHTGGYNTFRVSQLNPSYCGECFQMVVVLSQCSKERDSTVPILVRDLLYNYYYYLLSLLFNVVLPHIFSNLIRTHFKVSEG
jgi:hypothetical protein